MSPGSIELCRLCAELFETCADEYVKHDNLHYEECAEESRICVDACRNISKMEA